MPYEELMDHWEAEDAGRGGDLTAALVLLGIGFALGLFWQFVSQLVLRLIGAL